MALLKEEKQEILKKYGTTRSEERTSEHTPAYTCDHCNESWQRGLRYTYAQSSVYSGG